MGNRSKCSLDEAVDLSASLQDKDLQDSDFCPICCKEASLKRVPPDMQKLKEHILTSHFPWYLAISNKNHDDFNDCQKTTLSCRLHPALVCGMEKMSKVPVMFYRMWGKLINAFLIHLCMELKLKSIEDLFTLVKVNKCYPPKDFVVESGKDISQETKLIVKAHLTFLNHSTKKVAFSPPSCLSGILHWISLTNIVCFLPSQKQESIVSYEGYNVHDLYDHPVPMATHLFSTERYTTGFWTALENNNYSALMEVVALKREVLTTCKPSDPNGLRPLNFAIKERNYPLVIALLLAGGDVDEMDREGWTPVCRAAFSGDLQAVKILLEWGVSKQIKGAHIIAKDGFYNDIAALLEKYQLNHDVRIGNNCEAKTGLAYKQNNLTQSLNTAEENNNKISEPAPSTAIESRCVITSPLDTMGCNPRKKQKVDTSNSLAETTVSPQKTAQEHKAAPKPNTPEELRKEQQELAKWAAEKSDCGLVKKLMICTPEKSIPTTAAIITSDGAVMEKKANFTKKATIASDRNSVSVDVAGPVQSTHKKSNGPREQPRLRKKSSVTVPRHVDPVPSLMSLPLQPTPTGKVTCQTPSPWYNYQPQSGRSLLGSYPGVNNPVYEGGMTFIHPGSHYQLPPAVTSIYGSATSYSYPPRPYNLFVPGLSLAWGSYQSLHTCVNDGWILCDICNTHVMKIAFNSHRSKCRHR